MHPTWIEIDLKKFRENLQAIRKKIGKAKFCLPVKGNAYGHGLVRMAQEAAPFVDCLGVSCLQEGATLRKAGLTLPILVFGAVHEGQIEELSQLGLEFSISSHFKADLVAKNAVQKCRVHLEVETGMQRTGVRPETAVGLMRHMRKLSCCEVVGVYSHLATADAPNCPTAKEQIAQFMELIRQPEFEGVMAHLANSGGVTHYPEAHLDMVRPGLMAYEGCFSLKSKVAYFKVVPEGTGIGYGHVYKTNRQTRIATVPIGYGDGYLRQMSKGGEVLIRGRRCPIIGNICMDQFMVEVEEAFVGDEVVLIGKQGKEEITLGDVAKICNTIPYEILCLLNERIVRVYH